MQFFQLVPQRAQFAMGEQSSRRAVRFAARVAHAVEPRFRYAAAGDEIHRALRTEAHRRDVQRGAVQELRFRARVAGAALPHLHGEDGAERPVADEQLVLKLRWEIRMMPEADGCRRARPHVQNRAKAVREIIAPHARVRPPAELRAARDVIDARGPIPRRADIELHVRVIGEKLALTIERDVHGVAKA